jgi:methyl-accepting chemotaxis protein
MAVVDQVAQRNASAAEELSSTAEEVASHAATLERMVAWFRIRGAAGASPSDGAGGLALPPSSRTPHPKELA